MATQRPFKWLKSLARSKPERERAQEDYQWTVLDKSKISLLLKNNTFGFTEDVVSQLLLPWGTEHDQTYVEVLQVLLSASLISYSYKKDTTPSDENDDPPCAAAYRKRLIHSLGGPFSIASARALQILERLAQGPEVSWASNIADLLVVFKAGKYGAREPWTAFRDILVVLARQNNSRYWPRENGFLVECTTSPIRDPAAHPGWLECNRCSHLILSQIRLVMDTAWAPLPEVCGDTGGPPPGTMVIIDERAWTEDRVSAPLPDDFPLTALVVDIPASGLIQLAYLSMSSATGTGKEAPALALFPRNRVFVSCEDIPDPSRSEALARAVTEITNIITRHADPGTAISILDRAQAFVTSVVAGNMAILPQESKVVLDRVQINLSDTEIFSKDVNTILRFTEEHLSYFTFPRNSEVQGQGTVHFKYILAPGRGGSSIRAGVSQARGIFTFNSAQCSPRAEHITRVFYGSLEANGLPAFGHMRIVLSTIRGDPRSDVFEVESTPSAVLSYTGSFQNGRPHGQGTLVTTKLGHPLIAISGKWSDSGRAVVGNAKIEIADGVLNGFYSGTLTGIYPHGKGHIEIFIQKQSATLRRSFRGAFQNGFAHRGTLYSASASGTSGHHALLVRYSGSWDDATFAKGTVSTSRFVASGEWGRDDGTLRSQGTWTSSDTNLLLVSNIASAYGQWVDGLPNGESTLIFEQPNVLKSYEGCVSNGTPHGQGTAKIGKPGSKLIETVETGTWVRGTKQGVFLITRKTNGHTRTIFVSVGPDGTSESITPKQFHMSQMNLIKSRRTQKRKRTPDEFLCPITHEVMTNPHIAEDGNTYELWAIRKWLAAKKTSPMTNEAMGDRLIENRALKHIIKRA